MRLLFMSQLVAYEHNLMSHNRNKETITAEILPQLLCVSWVELNFSPFLMNIPENKIFLLGECVNLINLTHDSNECCKLTKDVSIVFISWCVFWQMSMGGCIAVFHNLEYVTRHESYEVKY